MKDFYEYNGSLFFPLKSDEKAVPLINDQVLETQTLFEIEKGEIDVSTINFSLN